MAQCFRAEGGIVVEVMDLPDSMAIADCFHDEAGFLEGPSDEEGHPLPVAVGMLWDGKVLRPAPPPPPIVAPMRLASTYQLFGALTDAQRAAYPGPIKAWDQRMFSARDTPWPEDNPKIARIASALSITPAAWFDAALNPPAASPAS